MLHRIVSPHFQIPRWRDAVMNRKSIVGTAEIRRRLGPCCSLPASMATSVGDRLAHMRDHERAMVDELAAYVRVESGSRDKAGVDHVGGRLAEAFGSLGFAIERMPEATSGDHLVARRKGSGRGHLLALIHLDTVWPSGTLAENPFRLEDGHAFGPGVLDMKGGWVVLLSALRSLAASGWDGLAQTTVFMSSDEELGSPTARSAIERVARDADWALVMEAAREDGALVTSRGAVGALTVRAHGVTAHSIAAGKRGASAIRALASAILDLEALTERERGVVVSVGIVEGGSARQVIPDRAWASVDLRAPTSALADATLARIRAILASPSVPSTALILEGGITRPAWEPNPGTDRLLDLARRCGGPLGLALRGTASGGGSDGNFTAALGIPTIDGLGPQGANLTARNEYVAVDSLAPRSALLAGIISGLPSLLSKS